MTIRLQVALWMGLATAAYAQVKPSAAIPATAPTTVPAATSSAQTPPVPPVRSASVTWEAGKLRIVAQNSSLNSILRDVALKTGMKIVGGVQEERVFGTYGPDVASKVLAQLMDGTGSNMQLQTDTAELPVLLTLTPTTGGVSPPNPMQAREEEAPPPPEPEPVQPQPAPQPERGALLPRNTNTNRNGSAESNGTTTQEQAPNGVRTPQQIFEQLQKMRQQRPQTPTQ